MRVGEPSAGETRRAFAAMHELRTQLSAEAEFVRRLDELQPPAGYRLVAAIEDDGTVSAVAGSRVLDTFACGRMLSIEDLSTLPASRRRGLARALPDCCEEEGVRLGCDSVQLDSAAGPERLDAHRL